MMQFQCPFCQFINSFEAETMGRSVACGHCKQVQQAPESPAAPGIVLGDFVLGAKFRSRMGTSDFEGLQLSLERQVLLKIVDPDQNENKPFIKDFLRMARAASQTLHPNLIYIFAAGFEGGCYYVAREPAAGQSLVKIVRREGRLSAALAINITIQVAEALAFAWRAKQLIHGNLKPDYILVDDHGHVKLLDLGLAMLDPEPEDDSVKGTPHYLSPERIQGEPLDMRVDIYSLGVILYEMLVGSLPFTGESQLDVLHAHLMHDAVPPHTLNPTISEELSRIVIAMLAREPGNRYPNGAILAEDLRLVLQKRPPSFAPSLAKRKTLTGSSDAGRKVSFEHDDFVNDDSDVDFIADPRAVTSAPGDRKEDPGADTAAIDTLLAQAQADAKTAFNFRTGIESRERALRQLDAEKTGRESSPVAPAPAAPISLPADDDSAPSIAAAAPPAAPAPAATPAPERREAAVKKAIPVDPDSPAAKAAREQAQAMAAQEAAADDADADEDDGPDPEYADDLSEGEGDEGPKKKKKGKGLFGPAKKKKFTFKTTNIRLPQPRKPPES